jgi:hypothetical protein
MAERKQSGRRERLSAALRENLKRRKAQARSRQPQADKPADGEPARGEPAPKGRDNQR